MTKVSIIIPVYNGEKFLEECLNSVIGQTYPELEIVIINDGSTDHTIELCKKYCEKDSRIILIDKENGGVTSARKAGIDAATGKYTIFVDADDWIPAQTIERLTEVAETNETDVVSCGFVQVESEQSEEHYGTLEAGIYELADNEEFISSMFYQGALKEWGIWPTLWGKLFLTEEIRACIRHLDERIFYGEDAATVFETILQSKRVAVIKEPLYYYRYLNTTSVSGKRNKLLLDNMFYLYEYLYKVFEKQRYAEILLKQLKHYMISLMNHAGKLLFDIPYNIQQSEWLELQVKEWQTRYYDFIYARRELWAVPLYDLEGKHRVVLYGTGEVAEDFRKQLTALSEVEILAWLKERTDIEEWIQTIDPPTDEKYDIVLMAVHTQEELEFGKKLLLEAGVDANKIIWEKPVRLELNNMQFFESEGV